MEAQSCSLTQTMQCHRNIICPASSSGKQSMCFSELLCFPFTVTDKDQMNQGAFWKDRMRGKRKMIMTFQSSEEGT